MESLSKEYIMSKSILKEFVKEGLLTNEEMMEIDRENRLVFNEMKRHNVA